MSFQLTFMAEMRQSNVYMLLEPILLFITCNGVFLSVADKFLGVPIDTIAMDT